MNLSNLKKASDYSVEEWLTKSLDLTPYQRSKMRTSEMVRFSNFYFYEEKQKEKVSFLWRFTIIFWPIYFILLCIGYPFTMVFTGKWGYGRGFVDNFHSKWANKLKL